MELILTKNNDTNLFCLMGVEEKNKYLIKRIINYFEEKNFFIKRY